MFCLGLTGRIIVAGEGSTEHLKEPLRLQKIQKKIFFSDARFKNMNIKTKCRHRNSFPGGLMLQTRNRGYKVSISLTQQNRQASIFHHTNSSVGTMKVKILLLSICETILIIASGFLKTVNPGLRASRDLPQAMGTTYYKDTTG